MNQSLSVKYARKPIPSTFSAELRVLTFCENAETWQTRAKHRKNCHEAGIMHLGYKNSDFIVQSNDGTTHKPQKQQYTAMNGYDTWQTW